MDAKRFDAITKAVTRLPRRQVLAGVAAGALAPLLGIEGREASAQTCQRSDDCPGNKVCRNRTCVARCGDPGTRCNYPYPFGCQNNPECFCAKKPGGGGLCTLSAECPTESCSRHSDCPEGHICVQGCGGGENCEPKFACQPACPLAAPGITAREANVTRSEGGQAQMGGRGAR